MPTVRSQGRLIGEEIIVEHKPTSGQPPLSVVLTWLRDPARWRELGHLAFSATGGFVMSGVMVLPLVAVATYLSMPFWLGPSVVVHAGAHPRSGWRSGGPQACPCWQPGPASTNGCSAAARPRALRERVFGGDALARRDCRPLGRGAAPARTRPARRAAGQAGVELAMSLGLAEHLIQRDPEEAAKLVGRGAAGRRSMRSTTCASVVRGIHPPVLADRGLSGAGRGGRDPQLASPVNRSSPTSPGG